MTRIRFCGPVAATSGYGEFSRYFINSLHKAGIDITVDLIPVDVNQNVDYGPKGDLCKKLLRKSFKPDVNIINMIPPMFKRYRQPNTLNIGFTMWEADRLPDLWVKLCNDMDAIFVPCKWNEEVFKRSGVQVPVYVVQPGVSEGEIPTLAEKPERKEYKFYSIFQWTARKNPEALLKSYFATFAGVEDVSLTLKTYKHKVNNGMTVEQEITGIKNKIRLSPGKSFPKLNLIIGDHFSREEIARIHHDCDCFVSTHRAEGWGLSLMNAMLHGNPVIGTKYSGNMDFMNEQNSYLVDYSLTPVSGMEQYAPWFFADQMKWADINMTGLAGMIQFVYDEKNVSRELGQKGRKFLLEKFNNKSSAVQLLNAISDLQGKK